MGLCTSVEVAGPGNDDPICLMSGLLSWHSRNDVPCGAATATAGTATTPYTSRRCVVPYHPSLSSGQSARRCSNVSPWFPRRCLEWMQVVWKETTSVGVAMAKCPGGRYFVVADYDPAGNSGAYEENVPRPTGGH